MRRTWGWRKTLVFVVLASLVIAVSGVAIFRAVDDAVSAACGDDNLAREGSEGGTGGGRIVFSTLEQREDRPDGDVFMVNADGSTLKRLTSRPGPHFDPTWSPDGTRIAYRDSRHGFNVNDQIYVMNADGSAAENISRNANCCDWSPAWSPDGEHIALNGLDVIAADGSSRRRLTLSSGGEYPTWSPDGSWIAYAAGGGGGYDIWVVRCDGSDARRLTSNSDYEMAPAWSPDGDWLLYARGEPSGGRQIWIMRRDGSDKRRLTRSRHDDFFSDWSPDGDRVVFTRDGVLFMMNADGSDQRSLRIEGDMPDWGR